MIREFKALKPNLAPRTVLTDFGKAATNVIPVSKVSIFRYIAQFVAFPQKSTYYSFYRPNFRVPDCKDVFLISVWP